MRERWACLTSRLSFATFVGDQWYLSRKVGGPVARSFTALLMLLGNSVRAEINHPSVFSVHGMSFKPTTKVCYVAVLVCCSYSAPLTRRNDNIARVSVGRSTMSSAFGFTLMFCLAWPRPLLVGGSPHGLRDAAGGLASSYTGSPLRSAGCILRRRWGAGGRSAC